MSFLLEHAGGLAELMDWFRAAFAGWGYILSPAYRHEVHHGWRFESRVCVAWDILCALAGFLFTLFLGYLFIGIFAGSDWLPRLILQ